VGRKVLQLPAEGHTVMHAPHHFLETFSLLGMVLGTIIVPVVILGTIFFIVRMAMGY
jgi:hypothetical protein